MGVNTTSFSTIKRKSHKLLGFTLILRVQKKKTNEDEKKVANSCFALIRLWGEMKSWCGCLTTLMLEQGQAVQPYDSRWPHWRGVFHTASGPRRVFGVFLGLVPILVTPCSSRLMLPV